MRPIAIVISSLLPLAAFAAEPAMSGPLAGYVLDGESRSARAVLGVPGAAYAGAAILADVDALAVSPDGLRALAAQSDGLALVTRLATGDFEAARIENSSGADKLAWSGSGAAAVAYSSGSRTVQVLLEGKIDRLVELSGIEGVSALAVDDTGDHVLIGAEAGLYLAVKGGDTRLVAALAKPVAIALRGADAFVVAAGVVEIEDYAGKATVLTFASEPEAVGAQLSRDGKRLVVALANAVAIYDIVSRSAAARIDLDFTPTMLARFGSGSAYLLHAGKAGVEPLYVVDASASPAVFFVPAGRQE
jgi:hypothetical protein